MTRRASASCSGCSSPRAAVPWRSSGSSRSSGTADVPALRRSGRGLPAPVPCSIPDRRGRAASRRPPRATTSRSASATLTSGSSRTWPSRRLGCHAPADRLVLGTRADELWRGSRTPSARRRRCGPRRPGWSSSTSPCRESRAEALLSLGHPAAAVRLLAPVAADHPYREQLWALLARAQYACARQADALATLATLRSRLAEDLGVDPSPVVRAMEQRDPHPGLRAVHRDLPSAAVAAARPGPGRAGGAAL